MFKIDRLLSLNALADLKETARAFPRRVRHFVEHKLKPHVVDLVNLRLKQKPPERGSQRFLFATDKSRRFYRWAARQELIPTVNGHYVRSDNLIKGWGVRIDRRRRDESVLEIYNDAVSNDKLPARNFSQWVYPGPRQVRGHFVTGWGANFNQNFKEITESSNEMINEFVTNQFSRKGKK